jgi:hypothetical protein
MFPGGISRFRLFRRVIGAGKIATERASNYNRGSDAVDACCG